jgi:hypothetical protein
MSDEAASSDKPAKAPKVTVRDTPAPAAKPIADKNGVTVQDELGRSIKIKKLSALMRYDLAKVIGGDHQANLGVMGPAAMAYSVTEIDGIPVFAPTTEDELRVIIQRLDDEGLAAVIQGYADAGWLGSVIDEAALKNS